MTTESKELYPKGTDLLWMAHFMPEDPAEYGSMNGPSMKISGTLEEAARIAEHESRTTGKLLQCLRRRY